MEFNAHGSNEKHELFFEWTAFKELCFDSMVIEKDVCCEKKANKQILKRKKWNHPVYRERYGKQGGLWKIWSAGGETLLVTTKLDKVAPEQFSRLSVESALEFLKNAALYSTTDDKMLPCTAQLKTKCRIFFKIWKFIFKRKIVSFKANEGNRVFQ